MVNKATHQQRVRTGFNTLFDSMGGDTETVNSAKYIIDTALEKLNMKISGQEDKLAQGGLGFFDKKKLKSETDKSVQDTLEEAVDLLVALGASSKERSQEESNSINTLKDSLKSLVGKEGGVKSARAEFANNAHDQFPAKDEQVTRVGDLWQKLREASPKMAKLVSKDKEMGLSAPYHEEALFDLHLPIASGTGTELIQMINVTFNTGNPPAHLKTFDSGNPNETLYNTMKRTLKESDHSKRTFVEKMTEEFKASPDIPTAYTDNLTSVKYLQPEERGAYKLTIKDGLLYQGDKLYDTSEMHSKGGTGKAAFVITSEGEILSAEHKGGEFHHSSFLSGERTVSAGMLEVKDGKIMSMDNVSGHYKPQEHNITQGLKAVPNINTAFHETGTVTVQYSPTQKAPESVTNFMKRAEPLAEEKWKEVKKERETYRENLHKKEHEEVVKLDNSELEDFTSVSDEKEKYKDDITTVSLKNSRETTESGVDYFPEQPKSQEDKSHESLQTDKPITLEQESNPQGFRQEATQTGREAVKEMFALTKTDPIDVKAFEKAGRVALENEVENFKSITLDGKTLRKCIDVSKAPNADKALDVLKMKKTKVMTKGISKQLKESGLKKAGGAPNVALPDNKVKEVEGMGV